MAISAERRSFKDGVAAYVDNPADRAGVLYRLTRSIAVGRNLDGAIRAGTEISEHAGLNRIAVVCMDPRNVTGVIRDSGVQVIKFGGAVGAIREARDRDRSTRIQIPASDFFAGSLRAMAMDRKRQSLLIASSHHGDIPCGYMFALEHEMRQAGIKDPYQGDTVAHNSMLIQQGTIGPATEIFNWQLASQGSAPVKKLGIELPWNTDRATFVLNYDHKDPGNTLTVADLVLKHAAAFRERFGVEGQFRSNIKKLDQYGDFWAMRTRMVKELSDGNHFKGFQEDLREWIDNSAECDGLTGEQLFGLVVQLADNAALGHLLNTPNRALARLAEFSPHQLYVSLNGVTLDERDPTASRLSSSPLNGEDVGDTLINMANLSFEKAEMVQAMVDLHRKDKGSHRLLQVPPRRVAFVSYGVRPDDNLRVALSQLGRAIRSVHQNLRSRKFIEDGRLSIVPVVVDLETSAAIMVPVFPDYSI